MTTFLRIATVALAALILAPSAQAWGPQGHALIGEIASDLLNPAAREQVHTLLGFELSDAAKWPDCVRDVQKGDDGTFKYVANPHYRAACGVFTKDVAEIQRMVDYAARNWDNCRTETARAVAEVKAGEAVDDDSGAATPALPDENAAGPAPQPPPTPPAKKDNSACASSYHFADVAIERDGYAATFGTSDHDVVHAIAAAIAVLGDKPAPTPFSILDKKEALLLLAHFVGDMHQPLHVGALYLSQAGAIVDPDQVPPEVAAAASTRGGNWLLTGKRDTQNLHAAWDSIPASWSIAKSTAAKRSAWDDAARAVPVTTGAIETWPGQWASESVTAARSAFEGLTFAPEPTSGHWSVTMADKKQYAKARRDVQRAQITKAAARLAETLNALWPDH